MPRRHPLFPLCLALCAALLCAGCSKATVRHLDRQPWLVDEDRSLTMRFWRFDYRAAHVHQHFAISGRAWPAADRLPAWAERLDELWLAAYLSDAQGRVIAQDIQVMDPGRLTPSSPTVFAFSLTPEDLGRSGPLYVSFGYRMVVSGPPESGQAESRVFFANEGALRY